MKLFLKYDLTSNKINSTLYFIVKKWLVTNFDESGKKSLKGKIPNLFSILKMFPKTHTDLDSN